MKTTIWILAILLFFATWTIERLYQQPGTALSDANFELGVYCGAVAARMIAQEDVMTGTIRALIGPYKGMSYEEKLFTMAKQIREEHRK
jgi:hypothetical protein